MENERSKKSHDSRTSTAHVLELGCAWPRRFRPAGRGLGKDKKSSEVAAIFATPMRSRGTTRSLSLCQKPRRRWHRIQMVGEGAVQTADFSRGMARIRAGRLQVGGRTPSPPRENAAPRKNSYEDRLDVRLRPRPDEQISASSDNWIHEPPISPA